MDAEIVANWPNHATPYLTTITTYFLPISFSWYTCIHYMPATDEGNISAMADTSGLLYI